MEKTDTLSLSGKFLIAMPGMSDPRFDRSVIYICSHDENGAMGLIINKTKGTLQLSQLLKDTGIDGAETVADAPVLDGGPVDINRGFVLHTADYYDPDKCLRLSDTLALSSNQSVLESLVGKDAPDQAVLLVGYSGWGEGQIEDEISKNAWMVVDAQEKLIFDTDMKSKWARALATLGITPDMLSGAAGRA